MKARKKGGRQTSARHQPGIILGHGSEINSLSLKGSSMHKQIEDALKNLNSSPTQKQKQIKAILSRYAKGESAWTRPTMSFSTMS